MDTHTKALLLACYNCDVQGVKDAITNGADVNGMEKPYWKTPIAQVVSNTSYRVADETRIEIIQLLLDAGADVNLTHKKYTQSPLHYAVLYSVWLHYPTAAGEYILQKGASVHAVDSCGNTPLLNALHYLYDNKYSLTTKHSVESKERCMRFIWNMIDAGGDLHKKSSYGLTSVEYLLHLLPPEEWSYLIERMMRQGVSLNIKLYKDWTLLMYATRENCIPVMIQLIDAGVDLNAQTSNKGGLTALMMAAQYGETSEDALQVLLDAGADLNVQCVEGWTALHAAAFRYNTTSSVETVRRLLDAGINCMIRNKEGKTAFDMVLGTALEPMLRKSMCERRTKQMKEQLIAAAWHPSRMEDWCLDSDMRAEM